MARVLHLITSSGIGGAESALAELCARLDRSRWEPTVVCLKEPGATAARLRALGVEVLSLGMRQAADAGSVGEFLLGAARLPRLLRGRRFDVLHSFLFRANLLARVTARRLGSPRVVNAVRVTPEEERPWMRRVDRLTCRRVDRFLALSEHLAQDLRTRLPVAPERVVVIPNGVDLAAADAALAVGRPAARHALGLYPSDLALAFVGRLHRQKGLKQLLGAFFTLLQTHPTAKLLLAGGGPEREALASAVAGLRLQPFVRFLGPLPTPWPLLAAADLFVLPSLWEGMPNALLEAMAAGLPCVATTVGAVPEVAGGGEGALLVPPGDAAPLLRALLELADDPARRRELGARGRRRVEERFRIETTVARTQELYAGLLP
jgi:glycosyltransferase involved in cell wall biosynthesis